MNTNANTNANANFEQKKLKIHCDIKSKLDYFIKQKKIPNIIFHGSSGCGKNVLVTDFINMDGITGAITHAELTAGTFFRIEFNFTAIIFWHLHPLIRVAHRSRLFKYKLDNVFNHSSG